MVNYWTLVNNVILEADILLLVLDSSHAELTRNKEIEQKILNKKKKLLYVLNKCDLVEKSFMETISKDYYPSVFVSSKKKFGGTILFKKIMQLSRGKACTVGVLGYPNVGKSSVINLLKGKKSASVSSQSGHTRSIQFVSAKGKIKLIDTPGVLQFKETDILKQIIIGSKNPQHVKEPDYFAMLLIEQYSKMFEKFFDEPYNNDALEFLEKVALKRQILKKGGDVDLPRIGRLILQEWQKGSFYEKFLED